MSLQLFEGPQFSLLIKGGKQWFLHTKAVRLPITREIFLKITRYQPINGDKLNIVAALKVAWENFIHISKITFTAVQQVVLLFKDIKVTRANISFSKFD